MTPFMSGSVDLDYTPWESFSSLPVVQSVAISGAALAVALKQTVRLPRPDGTTAAITLSDGGHTENLGAFALIRRRVKNIIVVDAEMDRHFGFGAYRKLQEGLAREGLNLRVPLIEARGAPPNAVMKGTVTDVSDGERLVSTIYYVKMSLPPSTTRTWQNPADLEIGEAGAKRVTDVLRASKGDDEDAPVKCEMLDQEQRINTAEMLRYYVAKYSSFRAPYGDFPHFSTLDQSFYLDQSLAYLGLGYLQACELSTNPQLGLKEGVGLANCHRLVGTQ
jgi:hypothetical protein